MLRKKSSTTNAELPIVPTKDVDIMGFIHNLKIPNIIRRTCLQRSHVIVFKPPNGRERLFVVYDHGGTTETNLTRAAEGDLVW